MNEWEISGWVCVLAAPLVNPRRLPGGPRAGRGTLGGHASEWPWLITRVSISSLFQRPGRGVWARTGCLPHKSPDLCGSCLLAAMSPVPSIYLREPGWDLAPLSSRLHVFQPHTERKTDALELFCMKQPWKTIWTTFDFTSCSDRIR